MSTQRHEEKRGCPSPMAALFVFLPCPGPVLCKLGSQECCVVYLRSWLQSSDLPLTFFCSIFEGFSLPCLVSSVAQSCPTLCDPMNHSMPGLLVHHQLPEFTQTHVHWVDDDIQPSHPLSFPSPSFNLSQPQGLFQWVSSSHQVAKILEFSNQRLKLLRITSQVKNISE